MRPQDMNKFQATMAALAEVFGKQLSPPLTDLYWDALKPMAIEQFQEGSKSWIRYGKHFPKPAELLDRFKEMQAAAPKGFTPLPPAEGKWLRMVNGMFLQYLSRRRLEEKFQGDIDIPTRRVQCLKLAGFFDNLELEGLEPTEEQMKTKFDALMLQIQDKTNDIGWLAAQLEFHRRQDAEKMRQSRDPA